MVRWIIVRFTLRWMTCRDIDIGFGSGFEFGEVGSRLVFVVLDGLEGVDDSFVASLKLGIVVQGFADRRCVFRRRRPRFRRLRGSGLRARLVDGPFRRRGQRVVRHRRLRVGRGPGRVRTGTDFCWDSILFETSEFGLCGEDVIVFGADALWTSSFLRS